MKPSKTKQKWKSDISDVPIATACGKFFAYNKRHSPHTQRHYKTVVLWFVDNLQGDIKTIGQLSPVHLRDFVTCLLNGDMKNNSINAHLTALKSFTRYLCENYDIDNAGAKVRYLKPEPPDSRFLSLEEYQKLLAVCIGSEEKDFIEFLGNTGLRSEEFTSLKWKHINKDCTMLNLCGKGRKFRHVPCNDVVKAILCKHSRQADSERFQLSERYSTHDIIKGLCRRLSERAGIPLFGPHAIRHYFATELIKRGTPIMFVSKALGHTNVATTQRLYLHFQPEYLNGVTDCLVGGAR
jgi:integrase